MEQKERVIGTTTYRVTQMDAVSALKIQTKLIKILGPGMVDIFTAIKSGKDKATMMESAAELLPKLAEDVDPDLINQVVLDLFAKGVFHVKGDDVLVVDFGDHFRGKAMEMWKVAGFILEANFSMGESQGSSLPTTKTEPQKTGN